MTLFKFKDWLFKQLPSYFWENDSNKDSNNQGLLERYLSNFGIELDDELVDYIHNFMDILDIKTTPDKFLPALAVLVGSPPDLDGTAATQRKLLEYIVSIYKIKGTECSYNLLFNMLGLGASITQLPNEVQIRYDTNNIFDDPSGLIKYDLSCEPCTFYTINYWDVNDSPLVPIVHPVSPNIIAHLTDIICLIQPIDCKLQNLNHALRFNQTITPTIDNNITISIQRPNAFDLGLIYDNAVNYDDFTTTSINNYFF